MVYDDDYFRVPPMYYLLQRESRKMLSPSLSSQSLFCVCITANGDKKTVRRGQIKEGGWLQHHHSLSLDMFGLYFIFYLHKMVPGKLY